VNGGLARSEGRRVIPSAGASGEGFVAGRAPPGNGRGSAQGSGWRESVIQRSRHRQKRCNGRGTGAVTATGSYEGSPIDRRHPGSSRSVPVTRSIHGWSWRPDAFSDPCIEAKSRRHGEVAALAKAREAEDQRQSATGVSEARSHQLRGKTTPTLMTKAVRQPS
jgi:hypothetical protein